MQTNALCDTRVHIANDGVCRSRIIFTRALGAWAARNGVFRLRDFCEYTLLKEIYLSMWSPICSNFEADQKHLISKRVSGNFMPVVLLSHFVGYNP